MGSEEGRRVKAEKILRLRALSALLLLVWTIAIPVVMFALYRVRLRDAAVGVAVAYGLVAAGLSLRIYLARCPNCSRPLYLFRMTGALAITCRRCGMSLQEMVAR
jgi:hypothetical protein